MAPSENRLSCRRAQVLLEAYADGELSARRRVQLEAHLAACFTCSQELLHARRVQEALRDLPDQQCDDLLVAKVAARIGSEAPPIAPGADRPAVAGRLRGWISRWALPAWQPAAAVLVIVLVVYGVGRVFVHAPTEQKITAADVQRAELQVRWVMAHLGEISRRTGQTVQKDVLDQQVAAPTARAVEEVLQEQENVTQ